jgi:uncharacterized protein YhaN
MLLQVSKLRLEVTRIKAASGQKAKQGKDVGKGVLEQVTNLKSALDDAKGGQEQFKMKARNADAQREAAARKEAQLRAEAASMRAQLEASEEEMHNLRQQVRPGIIYQVESTLSFSPSVTVRVSLLCVRALSERLAFLMPRWAKGSQMYLCFCLCWMFLPDDCTTKCCLRLTAPGTLFLQVSDLTASLDEERAYQEHSKMKIQSADVQREAAARREAQLRTDLSTVRLKLEAAEAEVRALTEQVQPLFA